MSTPNEAVPDQSGLNQTPTQPQPPSVHGPVIILQTSTYFHDEIRRDLTKSGFREGEHYVLVEKIPLAESYVTPGRVQLCFMGTIRGDSTDAVELAASLKTKNPQLLTGWLSDCELVAGGRLHFDFFLNKTLEGRGELVRLVGEFHRHE